MANKKETLPKLKATRAADLSPLSAAAFQTAWNSLRRKTSLP